MDVRRFHEIVNEATARGDTACADQLVGMAVARAFALLRAGRYREGWVEFEKRSRAIRFGGPVWDGSPFPDQTLLIQTEQGMGDTIQFARYVTLAKARGGRVVLRAQAPLAMLLRASRLADEVISPGDPLPEWHHRTLLMSLPALFGTTLETLPRSNVPYLRTPYQANLGGKNPRKVGLVWAGNPENPRDAVRSIPFSALRPLLDVPGADWFSLQVGPSAEQIDDRRVDHLGSGLTDFAITAAVVNALDLVITVDTSVAHLAGALGRPVWVLLDHDPDWRWMLGREDSPWYPTMRLFRQDAPGDWGGVVQRIAQALRR
ncbi:glycosyltransferase family 9 protein [Arenibaculum pallidiluteum]|uniref:glycosyltransferase family 9 protein n=1 Tax=Arenibaculum pallidiluteum TaxID=2812559 RepID=UPI001A961703|nr:glycosyltransferase family 9 protein [Arenibaculum pallidiluteum]